MVAEPHASSPPTDAAAPHRPIRARSHIQRLLVSLARLTSIKYRIAILKAKLTLRNIVLYIVFGTVALVSAMVGMIFLYIGLFQLVADFIVWLVPGSHGTKWAFLIFAFIHILIAFAVLLICKKMVAGKKKKNKPHHAPRVAP